MWHFFHFMLYVLYLMIWDAIFPRNNIQRSRFSASLSHSRQPTFKTEKTLDGKVKI